MRLGIFSTAGRDGSTVLLGASLLAHEDQQSFEWAFKEFKKAFGTHPHCIFTDGDKAMAAAIRSTWPHTKHLLCTWHLSQTIIKNTKGDHAHPQLAPTTTIITTLWVYTHPPHTAVQTSQVGFQEQDQAKRSTNSMVLGGKYAKILMFISSKRSIRNGLS